MTLTLLCALAQGAWADDVNYIYYTVNADGKTITKHTDGSQADPTVLTSTLLEKSNEDNLNTGWYVLNSTFSYGERIVISGDVHLILKDGYTLTAEQGIRINTDATKMTPNLSADILGDWREEIVLWDYKKPTELYIHTTTIETNYAVPTLMHDHTYRMGVCWQNTAYNQPPHLGYFLPDYIAGKLPNGIQSIAAQQPADRIFDLQGRQLCPATLNSSSRNTPRGLFIIRQGDKVRKVMMK